MKKLSLKFKIDIPPTIDFKLSFSKLFAVVFHFNRATFREISSESWTKLWFKGIYLLRAPISRENELPDRKLFHVDFVYAHEVWKNFVIKMLFFVCLRNMFALFGWGVVLVAFAVALKPKEKSFPFIFVHNSSHKKLFNELTSFSLLQLQKACRRCPTFCLTQKWFRVDVD